MESWERSRRRSALIYLGLASDPSDGASDADQGWLARFVPIFVMVIVANILADVLELTGWYQLLAYVGAGLIVGLVSAAVRLARRR